MNSPKARDSLMALLFLLLVLATAACVQNFEETKRLAESGDEVAQYNLGVMYHTEQGVPQDYAEAVAWYQKSAEQGHADAQLHLGFMYANGQGVPENDAEAAEWFRKSAEQGNAEAQLNMGVIYDSGQGVPQDYGEAIAWYRKALESNPNEAVAWNNLGMLYATAKDSSFRDPAQAVECALKAVALEEDSATYDTLAEAYFVSWEPGKAVEAIRKAIALEPDNKFLHDQLGRFEQGR